MQNIKSWWMNLSGGKIQITFMQVCILLVMALFVYMPGQLTKWETPQSVVGIFTGPIIAYCIITTFEAFTGGLKDITATRQNAFWFCLGDFLLMLPLAILTILPHL